MAGTSRADLVPRRFATRKQPEAAAAGKAQTCGKGVADKGSVASRAAYNHARAVWLLLVRLVGASREVPLVAAAVAWCGTRTGFWPLSALSFCSLVNAAALPATEEEWRQHVSTGLLLGTTVLPTLFAVDSERVETLSVAFKMTWWCSLACNAMRAWSTLGRRAAAGAASINSLAGVALLSSVGLAGGAAVTTTLRAASSDVALLPALVVFGACLALMPRAMPRSFTVGEAVVGAQLLAVLSHVLLFSVVLDVTPLEAMASKLRKIIAIGLFSALGMFAANLLLRRLLCTSLERVYRGMLHTSLTIVLIVAMLIWMSASIGENSLMWFWVYITEHTATPLKFIFYYVAVLIPSMALAPHSERGSKRQIVMRKYFHVVATVLCAPTILINIRFMALVFAVVLAVLVVLESLRMSDVPFVVDLMNPFMQRYVDERDEGAIVLTHIYLLVGCALPVFFTYFVLRGIFSAAGLLIALSGVTVTGLGDAAASFVGVRFGRHRWPGSKKTLEGTCAMIVAVLAFQACCLRFVGFHNLSGASWGRLLLADVLVALLEARTDQIDNVFLPLFHVALLQMV